jgi:protein TonB
VKRFGAVALLLAASCLASAQQKPAPPAKAPTPAPPAAAPAAPPAQGSLLKQVRDSGRAAATLNAGREQRFARERDAEAARLKAAQAEVQRNEARAAAGRKRWEAARRTTGELERRLDAATRELDTLYDAARGAAVDLHDIGENSVISAQFPQRMAALAPLAAAATRPARAELDQIWQALAFDAAQSGQVVRFKASVVTELGSEQREVLRVGPFAAFADGEYLALYPGGRELLEMDQQPPWRLRRIARAFDEGDDAVAPMVLDPTRGAQLLAEATRPGLFARLWHSGVGGYFIAAILLLALALALVQPLWLRSRLILDEHSIGVVAGTLAAFALVQWWLWVPREPQAREEQVAYVDLVDEQEAAKEDEPPPEPAPPPPPPPVAVTPESGEAGLPALAAPVAGPIANIKVPVQIAGGGSLTGAGFGGFARGTGTGADAYGRGQGFKGKPLVPLSTARPQMPEWACKQNIKGWVEAVFTVLPSGRVQNVKIVDAQPRGVYEIAAIESISNWIYAETDRAMEVKQRVPMDPADCAYNWR